MLKSRDYHIGSFLFLLIVCTTTSVFGQVSFRPTMIFVSEDQKIQDITIVSQSDSLQEVAFSSSFGFPVNTKEEGLHISEGRQQDRFLYDLTPYVRVFPEKIFLAPGQRQIVRLQVQNSPQFETGTYWTRLSIKSQTTSPEAQENLVPTGRQSTNINLVVRQNIGVFYKHGEVNTSLQLLALETRQENSVLYVEPLLKRNGNSPYIGSLDAKLYSSNDELVSQSSVITSVFFETLSPLRLNVADLETGRYRLVLRFTTSRGDATSSRLIQSDPLVVEEYVTINYVEGG